MRKALATLVMTLGAAAVAQSDRMAFLVRQLSQANDPRLRANAALILGVSKDEEAARALCTALADPDEVVRAAAARALGDLGSRGGAACLEQRTQEGDPAVRQAIARALALLQEPKAGGIFVLLEPVVDDGANLAQAEVRLADSLLREALAQRGAALGGQDRMVSEAVVKQLRLRGFLLKPRLTAYGAGLKIDLLVLTYPGQALKGSYQVKASGARPGDLLRVMVPKAVRDAAADLEWAQP